MCTERDEVAGSWRKLHNEDEMTGHVACMGSRVRMRMRFCGKAKKRTARRLDVGGWIILKWILKRWDRSVWIELMCLINELIEHGNES
jgi:hypothetical protein